MMGNPSLWSRLKFYLACGPGPWRYKLTLPISGSHTGRYALLHVTGTRGYPNQEDAILVVRRPGQSFRAVLAIRVPWDEEPLRLVDDAAHPEIAVVYQDFTLAWTDDFGRTIHRPPKDAEGPFVLGRFADHGIEWVRIKPPHLYVKRTVSIPGRLRAHRDGVPIEQLRDPDRSEHGVHLVWRLALDGSGLPELVPLPADALDPPIERATLIKVVGSSLVARDTARSPWTRWRPRSLRTELRDAEIDFFGGTRGRTML